MTNEEILNKINGGLIVSCQALESEPLYDSYIMSKMAWAAKLGGAVGIRANTVVDIKAIKEKVDLPIIGIIYVAEVVSDIIQVVVYKRTKRRVFKMAPLHHHFELCGWKEQKVVFVFWSVTAIAVMLTLFLYVHTI